MGISIKNLDNIDEYTRGILWVSLVAAAQSNNLGISGNYIKNLLSEANVPEEPVTREISMEELNYKINLMGITPMQALSNIAGFSNQYLLKLPQVNTYQGIVIYADTIPPHILAYILTQLDSTGYDYQIDTGFPKILESGPQPLVAIGDECVAHLLRVGRKLPTLIIACGRPSFVTATPYDRFLDIYTPASMLSNNQQNKQSHVDWNNPQVMNKTQEVISYFMESVDILLEKK